MIIPACSIVKGVGFLKKKANTYRNGKITIYNISLQYILLKSLVVALLRLRFLPYISKNLFGKAITVYYSTIPLLNVIKEKYFIKPLQFLLSMVFR